jgi:hypothetical protein
MLVGWGSETLRFLILLFLPIRHGAFSRNLRRLVPVCLKFVYFTGPILLEAELGGHPSHVWRAIIEGHNALAVGLVRCIGDTNPPMPRAIIGFHGMRG